MEENKLMPNLKKSFILVIICISFFCPQKAMAGTASTGADKAINFTSRTAYYLTKYSLRAGWFIIKKTTKAVKAVSISIFDASGDAFNSNTNVKPVNNNNLYNKTLPPPPPILE